MAVKVFEYYNKQARIDIEIKFKVVVFMNVVHKCHIHSLFEFLAEFKIVYQDLSFKLFGWSP